MKINIVLPFFNENPVGGIKVMYQYANELTARGHAVYIYHAMYTSWMPKGGQGFRKKKNKFFQHILRLKRRVRPNWFQLDERIKSVEVIDVSNDLIRNADVIFSTWWATALEVYELNAAKGAKFNLIQDAEAIMTDHPSLVYQSYQLPVKHLVIASYLKELLEKHNSRVTAVLPNAIDPLQFNIKQPIADRSPNTILMLYAEVERKGTKYGLDALEKIAARYPQLQVHLFGVIEKPSIEFPAYITYHYKPSSLVDLYNQCAVFISPSINEGWGLPAMEAMACGCACVCTNIEGHLDFMENGKTALLVPPANSESIADAVMKLMADKELRLNIALAANQNIRNFSWGKSAGELVNLFNNTQSEVLA